MTKSITQNLPDKLFVPCTGPDGSHVCHAEGKPHAYAFGYHQAAKLIYQGLDDGHPYWDFVALPLVMLYRHHVELMLKLCIGNLSELLDNKSYSTVGHDLRELAEAATTLADEAWPDGDRSYTRKIVVLCEELNSFDCESTAVRYPTDRRNGKTISLSIPRFDTTVFVTSIEWLVSALDGIDAGASAMVDAKREMESGL